MKRPALVIEYPSQLKSLSLFPGMRTPGTGRIEIADPRLPPETRRAWEQRLNRLYFACGCDKAALGLAVGVLGYLAWMGLRASGFTDAGWHDLWQGVVLVVVATGIGKFAGLAAAQRRLRDDVRMISDEWKVEPFPVTEPINCG